MTRKSRNETPQEAKERIHRQMALMGDHADSYVKDYGVEGARTLYQEKREELERLKAPR